MNPKYDIYEEIDRYLNEELSETELVQFKQKLSSDAEFKSIVEAQQIANDLIIDQEMIKLKARMSKEMNADNTGSGPWGKIILLSAVVTSAVLLYTYTHYSSSNAEDAKEIAVSAPASHHTTVEGNQQETTTTPVEKNEGTKSVSGSSSEASLAPVQSTPLEEAKKEDLAVIKEVTAAPILSPIHKEEVKQAVTVAEQVAKINCEAVHITAEVHVDYGFDNEGEATIIIDQLSVKGGSAPYSYAIDKAAFENDTRFSGVQDGVYHVRIKDRNNCVSQVKKDVVVKTPVKEIDEAFAPTHGERWKFPVKANADATLTIFNKSGATIYSTNISGGHPNEWDGRSNAGVELESGNYYFVIQYSARDVVKGHISIVK